MGEERSWADNGSTDFLVNDDRFRLAECAIDAVSGRWVIAVLLELATNGERRHNDLARATGLAHKPLDRVLLHLEQSGLVEREVDLSHRHPRVSYVATAWGRSFVNPAQVLAEWWAEGRAG